MTYNALIEQVYKFICKILKNIIFDNTSIFLYYLYLTYF